MPKSTHTWEEEVFLASPGDVDKYRDIVTNLIHELNDGFLFQRPHKLKLISFDDVRSKYGGTDPQDVINQQIGNTYDIIVLIFWCRLGTETPRSESGTVEEFSLALQRLKETNTPEIQIYFCDDPIEPSKLDATQFKNLSVFKAGLNEGLYRAFTGEDAFKEMIKKALRGYLTERIEAPLETKDPSSANLPC
ncbi:MAG TPA: hypothetical protein DD827_04475 [Gammaproteobacteria bacterium]|nr:hypothetical protein [Gammaproteobacteria bacterium]